MSLVRVVKGLECCSKCLGCEDCEDCPYYLSIRCNVKLMQDALAVIDELQAHNENLEKTDKYRREHMWDEVNHAKELAISDTVKKMQERLEAKMHTNVLGVKFLLLYKEDIDQITKEILEGSNEVQE